MQTANLHDEGGGEQRTLRLICEESPADRPTYITSSRRDKRAIARLDQDSRKGTKLCSIAVFHSTSAWLLWLASFPRAMILLNSRSQRIQLAVRRPPQPIVKSQAHG